VLAPAGLHLTPIGIPADPGESIRSLG
jgi:hypothetical protein